jgi:hypothetical protein
LGYSNARLLRIKVFHRNYSNYSAGFFIQLLIAPADAEGISYLMRITEGAEVFSVSSR